MKDMKKIFMLNNSQGVIRTLVGLKSRITSTKPLLTMLALLMVCLFGVNESVWGLEQYVTVTDFDGSTEFKDGNLDKVSNGTFKNSANHVDFTIGNISSYQSTLGSRLVYGEMGKNASKSSAFGWSTTSSDYNVSVSRIDVKIVAYQPATSTKKATAGFDGGNSIECQSNGLNYKDLYVSSSSLTSGLNLNLNTTEQATAVFVKVNTSFCIQYIKYTYKVTHKEYVFGFSATTGVDNASYGSAEATVANETVQAAVGKTSASTTATFSATPYDGYAFAGWYTTSTCTGKAESTSNPYKPTVNNSTAGSTVTKTLYAKFVPIEVSSAGSASAVSFNHPETKTVTLYFPVSTFADANADFNSPTITANKVWTIKSWNLNTSTHKVEVVCQFVANSDVAKGAYEATVTLNAKSNNSNTGTVTANVDLTPTLTYKNSSVLISVNDEDKFVINVDTLRTVYKGADNVAGDGAITYALKTASDVASITSAGVFYAKAHGEYTIVASAAKGRYYAKTAEFNVTVNKRTPTLQWRKTGVNDHIYASDTLANLAYASYGNSTFNLPFVYSVSPAGVLIPTAKKDSLIANPELTQTTSCTVTAAFDGNDFYSEINGTQSYTIEPKITPLFKLGEEDLPESPVKELKLKIGETANMTFVGTDESNNRFTYPTNAQYVSYTHNSVAHTGVITGTVAGDEVIQFHQTGTNTIFDHTRSIHVYVTKHEVTMSSPLAGQTYHVDDSIDFADAYSASVAPGEGEPAQEEVVFSSSNDKVVKLVGGKLRAVGAGEADLTFRMANNAYWTGDTIVAHVNIIKYDPVITWNMESSYPWGAVINNPVSSTSNVPFTIFSSNEAAAKVVDGKIEVYNKTTDNVTFTLSQPANYKYNAATTNVTKTISIYQPQNHVPFTIDNNNYGNYFKSKDGDVVWSSNGYKIGDGGWDNDEGYFIIAFTGIPSTLTFTKHLDDSWGQLPVGSKATVYESSDNSNWTEIWSDETRTDNVGSGELDLQPNTRYIKFHYNGSVYCHYNNIHVTDKTGIDAPLTYSFRTGYMGNLPTKRTIDVDWFNVQNCKVTLNGADKDQFVVVTTAFNANLDQYATAGIRVNYKHDKKGTHTATLHIESADIPAKTADITLTGTTEKAIQTMIWRDDITPIAVGKSYEKAVYATSGLDVTLTSENENIISVEGTTITGVSEGTTRLFVSQAGDSTWKAKNETIYVQVTDKKVQHIIWKDRLGNLKREEGKTVTMTLTAISDEGQEISYELDNDARQFASVNGNTLTISGWGTGKITAHQTGTNGYVAVSKTMNMASRNPNAGCNPLVVDNKSGELHTIDSEEYDINGEPEYLTFRASCDLIAINGLYVDEFYGGKYHRVQYIKRTGDNAITNNERSFGPFKLHRDATKLKFYTKVGATLVRYYNSVNVTLAKYLELVDNDMDFSSVDFGQVVYQEFYVDFSNISGVLDVEMATASEQFEIVTETLGNECGDINHYARVQVRFTGRTMGTENNTIVISNRDQRLEVPVSATVVKASQVITWNDEDPANVKTTDNVVLTATATSGEAVTFESSNEEIAETYDKGDGTWGLTIHKGGNITITAKQGGNANYGAAEDVEHTYNISRVTPTITAAPTADDIDMLHTALSNSNLSGGAASVDGSFAWENPETNATYGTHAYQVVFTPENQDWYTTATCEVNVKVDKATQTITWNFDQLEMYCNADITFDATASPSGLTVDYTTSDDKIAYVDGDNKLRIIKGGEVTITAKQEGDGTYAAAEPIAKTLNILREKPTVVTHPTATPMKIGKLRDNASLTGGLAELNGKKTDGSFAWKNGGVEVENVAGSFPRTVIFTPANSNYYDTVEFVMNVTVEKYAPTIAFTTLHGSDITYGDPLSMSSFEDNDLTATDTEKVPNETVAGSFAWKAATEIVNAGTPTMAKAIFTPNNQDWYTPVEFNIPVQVAQAEPTLHATAEEIFVVQTLSESHITNEGTPGTCSWDPSLYAETAYYEDGTHTLPFVFVSSDPNYKGGNGTVSLTVYPGCVFVGGNEGGWQERNNWVKDIKPAAGDNVLIKNDVEISSAIEVNGLTIANGVDVVVESGASLTVGAGSSIPREHYGNVRVKNGGKMNLGAGELKVNNFTLDASLGNTSTSAASGQVSGEEQLNVNGDVYFQLEVDPCGHNTYGWYDFVVPFEVDVIGGISIAEDPTAQMKFNVNYAVMAYDEAKRAVNGKDWNKFSGTMQPGRVYTITLDETKNWNTVVFKKKAGAPLSGDRSFTTSYSGLGEDVDNGWNGFGNGSLFHAELDVPENTLVQIYDHANKCYQPHAAHNYSIAVGTSFFMQVGGVETITLAAADGNNTGFMAPARTRRTVEKFNLSLTDNEAEMVCDRMWVGANEEATEAYVIGEDVLKMGTINAAHIARMWTTKGGYDLCAVETALYNNKANTPLSLYAPEAGSYSLAVDQAPEDATLYLTKNGKAIWNLSMSPYELNLEQGTTEGYGLRIVASQQTTTDIENGGLLNDANGVRKVLIDNVIYIVTPEGKMYDIVGKGIKF